MNALFPPSACLPLSVAPFSLHPPSTAIAALIAFAWLPTTARRNSSTMRLHRWLVHLPHPVHSIVRCMLAIRSGITRPCRTPAAVARPLSLALDPDRSDVTALRVLSGGSADRCGRRSPSGRWKPPTAPHFGNSPQFRTRWAHLAGQ